MRWIDSITDRVGTTKDGNEGWLNGSRNSEVTDKDDDQIKSSEAV